MEMKMKKDFPPVGGAPFDGPMPEMPEADVSHIKNKRLDLRYGSGHPRQVFDIYYPEQDEGPFPVLLHFHGGGFAIGDKRDFHIAELLAAVEHGYAFASCNYRRSGDAPFPAAVLDCRTFVDYLHQNASALNIDAERMCAFGGSAGGNLSALFAMNIPQFLGEEKTMNVGVACAVDWFGPTDFRAMDEQARANGVSFADHDQPFSPESQYAGGALQELDPAFLAKANPISYINEKMCPLLIQHGRMDKLVPFRQSEMLYEAIAEKLGQGRAIFLPLDTAEHDDPLFKSKENMDIMWAFLDKYLKNKEPDTPIEDMPLPKGGSRGGSDRAFGLPPMGGTPPMAGKPPMGEPHGGWESEAHMGPPMISDDILGAIKEKYLDIPYCHEHKDQMLDLYLPNERGEGKLPVVVHFHGGAFMICNKRDEGALPMLRALDRGYAVVSAEYRKSGAARFPAMVYDAKTVIRWIRANAEKYGLDTERIALWGPSSGGWLCSFTAVTNDNPAFENPEQGYAEYSSHVHACVDWCGPCGGFLAMDEAFRKTGVGIPDHDLPTSPESLFLGAHITEVPELVRLACPAVHVTKDVVPFLIVHGGADPVVPVEQSKTFYNAIVSAGGEDRARLFIKEDGGHHGSPWYDETWLSDMCLDFLDSVLK